MESVVFSHAIREILRGRSGRVGRHDFGPRPVPGENVQLFWPEKIRSQNGGSPSTTPSSSPPTAFTALHRARPPLNPDRPATTTTPATVETRPAATARDLWMSFSRERRRRRPRKSPPPPDSRSRSGATRPPTGCTPSTCRSRDRSCRAFVFVTGNGSPLPGWR